MTAGNPAVLTSTASHFAGLSAYIKVEQIHQNKLRKALIPEHIAAHKIHYL